MSRITCLNVRLDDMGAGTLEPMTIRRVPERPIHLHGQKTARALRALADRAERGEVLGVAVAALRSDRESELSVAGVYEQSPHLAHYAVSRLQDALLFPDGGD